MSCGVCRGILFVRVHLHLCVANLLCVCLVHSTMWRPFLTGSLWPWTRCRPKPPRSRPREEARPSLRWRVAAIPLYIAGHAASGLHGRGLVRLPFSRGRLGHACASHIRARVGGLPRVRGARRRRRQSAGGTWRARTSAGEEALPERALAGHVRRQK